MLRRSIDFSFTKTNPRLSEGKEKESKAFSNLFLHVVLYVIADSQESQYQILLLDPNTFILCSTIFCTASITSGSSL